MRYLAAILSALLLVLVSAVDHHNGKFTSFSDHTRITRAAETSADVMARNILEWIQGIYRQGARRTRQESNGYLPPFNQRPPERPRPFQPASTPSQPPSPSVNEVTNFQPPPPSFGGSGFSPNQSPTFGTTPSSTYIPQSPGFPGTSTTYIPPSATYGYPSSNIPSSGYPSSGQPSPTPGQPTFGGYPSSPSSSNGYPSPSPTPSPPFPTPGAAGPPTSGRTPMDSYGYPSQTPTPGFPTPTNGRPSGTPTPGPTPTSPGSPGSPSTPGGTPGPSTGTPGGDMGTAGSNGNGAGTPPDDDDSKHPPHIHELMVQCSKTMMTIDIEFNRPFDGVIYSKGFYMMPECKYVNENSGQTKYSFTVSLDSCGTEFINDFEGDAGQAYLENVLVLQNEPGIQEVWDTVRRVRCLWEGNINKALTVSLSVDMLNQEIVTFSGDTATAKLDIQVGKGPFASAATGLVKIGEPMTLVVSVEGDPGFDLQVRDCIARDEPSVNVVQLTDERGCILKPKLFGAFQKTKDTGNTGASIIAYAFFQAFKFPDVMDLFIECNVELCKTNCEACPDANQQIEPGRRRRREISYTPSNTSYGVLSEPVRMSRGFRVIMPDDLSLASTQSLENLENSAIREISLIKNICMSYEGFYTSFSLMLAMVVVSTISAGTFYMKAQRITREKLYNLPKGT